MKTRHLSLSRKTEGFTMLEILLVVAAIAILAGIVIVAINPGKQLAETRNAQRHSAVNTIINGIYQYSIDNRGALPAGVVSGTSCDTATNEVCITGGTCTGLIDLSVLTDNGTYLVQVPEDPSGSANANGTGYHAVKTTAGRIEVCAPLAEEGAVISVMK